MVKRKYDPEGNRTDISRYRMKTIPSQEKRMGRSMGEWYFMHLKQLPLWETMLINHQQTYRQAAAAVNYTGGNLQRRFRTHNAGDGVIAVWRIE